MLIYPTIKQAPIAGLSGFGGGTSSLVTTGGPSGPKIPSSASHFWDFTHSHEDLVGNIHFDVNTDEMELNQNLDSIGGPPGYTKSGLLADVEAFADKYQTSSDSIPDMSGDFTFDVCSYNPHAVNSNQNIVWCVRGDYDSSHWEWYVYNYHGSARFDTSNTSWSGRLGEAGGSSGDNYVEDKWCVSRLRRSSDTVYCKWYQQSGNSWADSGNEFSGSVSGAGPNISNSNVGRILLNGNKGTGYSCTNLRVAWMAFYSSSVTATPWTGS